MARSVQVGQRWRSTGSGYEFEIVGRSNGFQCWIVRLEDGVTTAVENTDFDDGESFELIESHATARMQSPARLQSTV